MAIARIYVPKKSPETCEIDYENHVWDYVLQNDSIRKNKDVKLLYMTQRLQEEDISLILDIKDMNAFAIFITKHITPLKYVKGIWLFNLICPRFFQTPIDTPLDFKRYTLTIAAKPQEYANIYDKISNFQPSKDAILTYLAYTFQAIEQDILLSIIARDLSAVEKFSNSYVKPIKGIRNFKITCIFRTKRLVSHDEWEEYIKSYITYISKPGKKVEKAQEIVPWELTKLTDKFVCC